MLFLLNRIMLTYLSRLSLFILLTCSFNSFAKYSEAMCILYKQQMQQYSDNTSSRSYRNAARDYDKNCSNPPPVKKTQAPVTKINNTEPEPVNAKAEDDQPTVQPSAAVNPLDNNAEENTAPVQLNEITASEIAVPITVIEPREEASTTATELSGEPVKEQVELPNIAPVSALPTATPINPDNDADTGSLLMPSLLLLAVLLLAGLLLLRLRAKKSSAPESIENNADIAAVLSRTADEKPIKPTASVVDDENKLTAAQQPIAQQLTTEQLASAEPQITDEDEDELSQEQLTQRIFSNDHDFKEPEVRTFDPDAPLPGQKLSVSPELQTNNEIVNAKQAKSTEPKVDDDNVEQAVSRPVEAEPLDEPFKQSLESTAAEPSAMTDSDDEVAKALAALNEELSAQEQAPERESDEYEELTEQHDSQTSEQKANPFANLSLDPSWDPNSTEKPTIAPKKTTPKSAKLIAAQERAKQLKTDE